MLNSRALDLAGISIETPEPIAGFIDRDINTGKPTGLFIDLDDWLDERLGPQPRGEEMEPAARQAAEVFLSKGITSFHDASPCNSLKRWSFFQSLVSGPEPFPRATLMPGFAHLREFVGAGLGFGAGDDRLRVGHCKIVLSQAGGTLQPSPRELREAVQEAASVGFPVAIHAVEEAEVEAAVEAIESVDTPGLTHRIEHASICPPSLIARLKAKERHRRHPTRLRLPQWGQVSCRAARKRRSQPLSVKGMVGLGAQCCSVVGCSGHATRPASRDSGGGLAQGSHGPIGLPRARSIHS